MFTESASVLHEHVFVMHRIIYFLLKTKKGQLLVACSVAFLWDSAEITEAKANIVNNSVVSYKFILLHEVQFMS